MTGRKSFLIDDILQTSRASVERPDASRPTRPMPIYLHPPPPNLPSPLENGDAYYRDDRLGFPPIDYQHGQLYDPLRQTSLLKGIGRCWTVLPSYPLSLLSRQHGQSGVHSHSKRKGGQVRFTMEQTALLERRFCGHKYLSPEDRRHLASQLKLSDRQVKTWFQNRRAKWRRAHLASSSDHRTEPNSSQSDSATSSNTIHEDESPIHSPIGFPS